ncbi:MAG: hypothetical protein LBN08_06270 [Lactobacillales bacterium]|jgi:hypothetical protein|nr:hypothetical protein [Lactobacillales bacterium]
MRKIIKLLFFLILLIGVSGCGNDMFEDYTPEELVEDVQRQAADKRPPISYEIQDEYKLSECFRFDGEEEYQKNTEVISFGLLASHTSFNQRFREFNEEEQIIFIEALCSYQGKLLNNYKFTSIIVKTIYNSREALGGRSSYYKFIMTLEDGTKIFIYKDGL